MKPRLLVAARVAAPPSAGSCRRAAAHRRQRRQSGAEMRGAGSAHGLRRRAQRAAPPPRAIDQRFANLAALYQRIGHDAAHPPEQCVAVRWDYAFFQMLIETNYRDVSAGRRRARRRAAARRSYFAGVGATVPGKPGEHFKDVATGVLAHLQHVLMYSTARDPQSGRQAHAPGAGRRAGRHAQIAPAGDLRRPRARMDRHRPATPTAPICSSWPKNMPRTTATSRRATNARRAFDRF